MRVEALGLAADLDAPWEGAIRAGEVPDVVRQRAAFHGLAVREPAVLHLSTVGLPAVRGDFGSGAVELLGPDDAFVAVVEYGPEEVGSALFATGPLPRRLTRRDFGGRSLQRALPGQAGHQHFCTEQGRPLCLYVVLGALRRADRLVAQVNDVLPRIEVSTR